MKSHSEPCVFYFEIVKTGATVFRWSVVIRRMGVANWTDIHGHTWEYQGPYTRQEAEPIFDQMVDRFGDPAHRAW